MIITHQLLPIQDITPEGFQPYGQVIFATADGKPFDQDDAQLCLEGIPRFYIMRLAKTGIKFQSLARHQQCTQCLGAVGGQDWFMAVAPASRSESDGKIAGKFAGDRLDLTQLAAFRISGSCFIKLHSGTWHAGPLFLEDSIDFYNLELHDTNIRDYGVYNLKEIHGLSFELAI
jgi:ureidoglycolate hydrolase